jgi:pyruvate,orthophosphate dikinase
MALGIGAAQRLSREGDPVVLVRDEALTQDIAGLAVCRGVVTATGARTSHAAVVARQLGVACVVGCRDLSFDSDHGKVQTGHCEVREGEWITVDGATGLIYQGEPEVCIERPVELIERVRTWRAQPAD